MADRKYLLDLLDTKLRDKFLEYPFFKAFIEGSMDKDTFIEDFKRFKEFYIAA